MFLKHHKRTKKRRQALLKKVLAGASVLSALLGLVSRAERTPLTTPALKLVLDIVQMLHH